MATARKAERRAELLSAFVDYVVRTGVYGLSLRPAATALGTSPRILLYYFGSREQLLTETMAEIRARERAHFAEEIQRRRFGGSIAEVVSAAWSWYAAKSREPYLRLSFELYGLAFTNPKKFQAFLDAASDDYLGALEEGLRGWGLSRRESRLAATLYRATFRGLLQDLLSTGDRTRINAAVRRLGQSLERELMRRGARRHPLPRALQPSGSQGRTRRGRRAVRDQPVR